MLRAIQALIKNEGVRAAIKKYGRVVVDRVRGKKDDVRWTQSDQRFIEKHIEQHGFQGTKNLLSDSKMLGPLIRTDKSVSPYAAAKKAGKKLGELAKKKRDNTTYKKGGTVVKKPVKKSVKKIIRRKK